MKSHSMLVLLVAMLGTSSASIGRASGSDAALFRPFSLSNPDRAAIVANVNTFADSWNRHDMKAMHDLDTPDVDWINVVGNLWQGVDNVRKGHTNFLHVLGARDASEVKSVTVRAIAPNVAIALTNFHWRSPKPEGKIEETDTRGSFVMVKRAGVWKITHFQNTIVEPEMQGPGDAINFDETTGLPKTAK